MNKIAMAASIFLIGLVIFLGLYLFVKGARNVQWAMASVNWPTAPGVVLHSDTTRDVTKGTRRTAASVTFSTKTLVQYSVNGQTYTTNILHFGQTLGSSDKSEAALQALRYPAGKEVAVSYNPSNPAVAAVRPGLHSAAFWLSGAGLAFLLPAVLCMFLIPPMFREVPMGDSDFEKSVQAAIAAAQRGETPPDTIPPPPKDPGDRIMPVVAIGFGAVACCLGLLALTGGILRGWHGYASTSWPTTPGKIIMAQRGGGENGEDAPDDTTDTASYARFVYEYTVNGVKHFNNLRRFAQTEGGSTEEAERIAERYRKGAAVKVSYFPDDPDVAVLEPGNTGAVMVLPAIGVVILLFGLAVFKWIVPSVARG